MRHTFGPVTSHRLGLSLGLDLIPRKTCNFDCIYCELGPTRRRTARRAAYVSAAALINEAREVAGRLSPRPEVLTLCGSGEPTLNSGLAQIIAGLKDLGLPVALLTNGSLFGRAKVRRAALAADIILPSLDAADDATLARLNRPLPGLTAQGWAEGLRQLRAEFSGRLWLEVMLVAGVNDSPGHLERLAERCREVAPARVQLTTVLRPAPGRPEVRPASAVTMALARETFAARLGCPVDVPIERAAGPGEAGAGTTGLEEALLGLLARRPVTALEAARALGAQGAEVSGLLARLISAGSVEECLHEGRPFYHARRRD